MCCNKQISIFIVVKEKGTEQNSSSTGVCGVCVNNTMASAVINLGVRSHGGV